MRERTAWDEFWWPPAFLGLGAVTKAHVCVWRALVAGFLVACALQALALCWRTGDGPDDCGAAGAACAAGEQAAARAADQGL